MTLLLEEQSSNTDYADSNAYRLDWRFGFIFIAACIFMAGITSLLPLGLTDPIRHILLIVGTSLTALLALFFHVAHTKYPHRLDQSYAVTSKILFFLAIIMAAFIILTGPSISILSHLSPAYFPLIKSGIAAMLALTGGVTFGGLWQETAQAHQERAFEPFLEEVSLGKDTCNEEMFQQYNITQQVALRGAAFEYLLGQAGEKGQQQTGSPKTPVTLVYKDIPDNFWYKKVLTTEQKQLIDERSTYRYRAEDRKNPTPALVGSEESNILSLINKIRQGDPIELNATLFESFLPKDKQIVQGEIYQYFNGIILAEYCENACATPDTTRFQPERVQEHTYFSCLTNKQQDDFKALLDTLSKASRLLRIQEERKSRSSSPNGPKPSRQGQRKTIEQALRSPPRTPPGQITFWSPEFERQRRANQGPPGSPMRQPTQHRPSNASASSLP